MFCQHTTRINLAAFALIASLSAVADAGYKVQGYKVQGLDLPGFSIDGKEVLVHFPLSSLSRGGVNLQNVRVERGGLVGELPHLLAGSAGLAACGAPTSGPARDCGWKLAAAGTCRPRAAVRIGAARGCELGSSSGNTMLRVCDGNATCEHTSSRRLAENDDSECGRQSPLVSFACPASGRFVVMAAEHASTKPLALSLGAQRATLQKLYFSAEDLAGTTLAGELKSGTAPARRIEFRITRAIAEVAKYQPETLPPRARGFTWLYTLDYRGARGAWKRACQPDADNRSVALPVASVWDVSGMRSASATHFSLSCTTGVIAKCYRWGYRPWWIKNVADPALMDRVHWACTRLARADYCGDGRSHTREGTTVDVFDNLVPRLIQPSAPLPASMTFESGWSTCGAVCLSHIRWKKLRPVCPAQNQCLFKPPVGDAAGPIVPNFCDTQAEAAQRATEVGREVRLFDNSKINTQPPLER